MSYANNDRYRTMEVMALSPARRLVMLYSHMLVMLKQARTHIQRGEIEARGDKLLRAETIVHELLATLDREAGGALAQQLASLYVWLLGEFAGIHSRPDLARLDDAIRIVAELHEAWEGAAAQVASLGAA